jgi:hypothetical protein
MGEAIMNEEAAMRVIYEGLSGEDCIPIKLRMGNGLDKAQLQMVKDAIRFLTQKWKSRDTVPKSLAASFVDIQSAMDWGKGQYSEAEQDEIEDAAYELVDLAYDLFDDRPHR